MLPVRHRLARDERGRGRPPAAEGHRALLLSRLFELADRPSAQYTLEVRTSNDGAISLYEAFGFRAAGRRRAYYHDNREDALIMWRTAPERATA